MSDAARIARLESLLATVTRRAAEPRPARVAAAVTTATTATTATAAAAKASAAVPQATSAPQQAPAATPPVTVAASEPAVRKARGVDPRAEPEPAPPTTQHTQHTRPTGPPPAEAASIPDLEFGISSTSRRPAKEDAGGGTPSGEFEIRSHAAPAVPPRRSSPPPANTDPMALDFDVGASDVSMEVDHAPLAVHANSVMPPSGAVPREALRIAAQSIPLDLPASEDDAERFAAPLLGDPDAVTYTGASPASGPPSFRSLVMRSLAMRVR